MCRLPCTFALSIPFLKLCMEHFLLEKNCFTLHLKSVAPKLCSEKLLFSKALE